MLFALIEFVLIEVIKIIQK